MKIQQILFSGEKNNLFKSMTDEKLDKKKRYEKELKGQRKERN